MLLLWEELLSLWVWTAHALWGDSPGLMAEQPGTTEALERDPLPAPALHLPYQLLSQREVSKSLDLLYVYLIIHL